MPSFFLRVANRLDEVREAEWDALLGPRATPFVRHAFLHALEESGCAAQGKGWRPRHLLVYRRDAGGDVLVGAAPAYRKEDSDGDFSRDFDWAAAAARARLRWYPKLSVTVPFTPVTGQRLLVRPGAPREQVVAALVQGLFAVAKEEKLASVHVLFAREAESQALAPLGLAPRVSYQFHWQNRGYDSMDAFLARFSSKRRAMIKREMAQPEKDGLHLRTVRGEELRVDHAKWARTVHLLHAHTVDQLMWGQRWLNQEFYERIFQAMPEALEVVVAEKQGRVVAGAFNLAAGGRLFGRYWGCLEEHPFLHFNVCLYHSIAECIALGREAFEGGAGGEHKFGRGFEPALTWSAHAGLEPRLAAALREALAQETPERQAQIARLREESGIFKPESREGGAA